MWKFFDSGDTSLQTFDSFICSIEFEVNNSTRSFLIANRNIILILFTESIYLNKIVCFPLRDYPLIKAGYRSRGFCLIKNILSLKITENEKCFRSHLE